MMTHFHENLPTIQEQHCLNAAFSYLRSYESTGSMRHKAEAVRQLMGLRGSGCIIIPLDGRALARTIAVQGAARMLEQYRSNEEASEEQLLEAMAALSRVWADLERSKERSVWART